MISLWENTNTLTESTDNWSRSLSLPKNMNHFEFDLDNVFKYHTPTPEQVEQYQVIRDAAKQFARVVINNTPECADQLTALNYIRQAMMTANAAIALDGQLYKND